MAEHGHARVRGVADEGVGCGEQSPPQAAAAAGRLGRIVRWAGMLVLSSALAAAMAAPAGAAQRHHHGHHHGRHHGRHHGHHHGRRNAHTGRNRKHHKHHKRKSSEHKVSAAITVTLTPPAEQLPQTTQINLFVPKRFKDAGTKMPSCTADQLRARGPGGCPKKTIVGGGKSIGYTIFGGTFVKENLQLTIFNGPKGTLLTWVEARTPVVIEEIVEGRISKPKGFGQELSFTIPAGLLEPVPGAPGWLQTLNATLYGKKGWLRTTSCPEHPWSLKAEFGYSALQGPTALRGMTVETKLACVK